MSTGDPGLTHEPALSNYKTESVTGPQSQVVKAPDDKGGVGLSAAPPVYCEDLQIILPALEGGALTNFQDGAVANLIVGRPTLHRRPTSA